MNPRELVVSSGGARGVLALGAIAELQRAGFLRDITSYAGTSVGAVIAAGLVLGRSPYSMMSVTAKHPIEPDIAPAQFGMDSGKGLVKWIQRVLGLRKAITLADLFSKTGLTLTICVCNLTESVPEYWTHETHPDVSLVKALRISCSVPLVFAAVPHRGKLYVDGAVADVAPVVGDPRKTLTVVFDSPPRTIDSMEDFVGALHEVMASRPSVPRYSISIDPGTVNPLDMAMPPEALRAAYVEGKRQASRWVKKNV